MKKSKDIATFTGFLPQEEMLEVKKNFKQEFGKSLTKLIVN